MAHQFSLDGIRQCSRLRKLGIAIVVLLLIYTLVGFFILPPILKSTLEDKLSFRLHRQATIGRIRCNPLALSLTMEDFQLTDPDRKAPLLTFKRLYMNGQIISLLRRAVIVKTLSLEAPILQLSRLEEQRYNFSDLLPAAAPEAEAVAPLAFSINNIAITDGTIIVDDHPKHQQHRVRELNLTIPFISNLDYEVDSYVEPSFAAKINNTAIYLDGISKPFATSRETALAIRIKGFNLPEYMTYLPGDLALTLESGTVDTDLIVSLKMLADAKPAISLKGTVVLNSINLTDLGGMSYLKLPTVTAVIADSNLLQQEIRLKSLTIRSPSLAVLRTADNALLPLKLIQPKSDSDAAHPSSAGNADKRALRLTVDDLQLTDGSIHFMDNSFASPFETTLGSIELAMHSLSTIPETKGDFSLSLKSEMDEQVTVSGGFSLVPQEIDGEIDVEKLALARYAPYLAEFMVPRVSAGNLDLSSRFHYRPGEKGRAGIKDGDLRLTDFVLKEQDETIVDMPSFSVRGIDIDLPGKSIQADRLDARNGRIRVVRNTDGGVNLAHLSTSSSASPPAAQPATGGKTASPWVVGLGEGIVESTTIVFDDRVPAPPATTTVEIIKLTTTELSTAAGSTGDIQAELRINDLGELTLHGPLSLNPPGLTVNAELVDLPLQPLQPYINQAADLRISDGRLSINGSINLVQPPDRDLVVTAKGSGQVERFASLDPLLGEPFVTWRAFRVKNIAFQSQPQSLEIGSVDLETPYINLIKADDSSLNLQSVLHAQADVEDSKTEAVAEQKKTNGGIVIDGIIVQNGRLDFLDRSITPNYATSLTEIDGSIKGLSSLDSSRADVNLVGKIDRHADMKITGTVNPLRDDLFADLKIDVTDFELSPVSPYSGRYIGYKIDKGKLFLDLNYQVRGHDLSAENHAMLDQFTLGDTVESPDAVNLPIGLAIALLKNRKDEITLDVPVRGNLDDPEFSIGGVIFKVIVNLIAKAATSPFALLGALIPEGEDINHIPFEPGQALVDDRSSAKLKAMAKALYDRPGLKVDIIGQVDPEADSEALRRAGLQRLVQVEKFKEITAGRQDAMELNDVTVTEEEYDTYLSRALETAAIKRPEPEPGTEPASLRLAMEEGLLQTIDIVDDDLRLLALERANQVKSFLVETGPVEPMRLFIIEPQQTTAVAGGETRTASQVEMVIK